MLLSSTLSTADSLPLPPGLIYVSICRYLKVTMLPLGIIYNGPGLLAKALEKLMLGAVLAPLAEQHQIGVCHNAQGAKVSTKEVTVASIFTRKPC